MACGELRESLTKVAKRPRLEAESGEEAANEDESLVDALEREVKELAQKIVDFRSSVPVRLGDIVSSGSLASQRSKLSLVIKSVASQPTGSESSPHSVVEGPELELIGRSSLTKAAEIELEKLRYLREKAESSIAGALFILNRVNECLARFNRVEQNERILSSLKRKK